MSNSDQVLGRLRPIRDDELATMLAWRNHPAVRGKMYTRHEISLAEHLAWWERIRESENHHYRMYEFQGQALGIAAITGIDWTHRNASWAFYAAPDAPRGTGSRMEFLLLEEVFEVLQLHRLHGEVLAFNQPVLRLHGKFGFTMEGVLRQQHWLDDHYEDVHLIGMLANEWRANRPALKAKLEALLQPNPGVSDD